MEARTRVESIRRRGAGALADSLLRAAASYPLDSRFAARLERVAGRLERSVRAQTRAQRVAAWRRHAEAAGPGYSPPEAVDVDCPLVLVTQAGRSGGTLLLRLLDGHSECLAVPHELSSMLPTGPLPRDPEAAFDALTPKYVYDWSRRGIRIGKASVSGRHSHRNPFRLQPALLHRLFVERLAAAPPADDRGLADAYLSAYFSAWRDVAPPQSLRFAVGFEPWAIGEPRRLEWFDAAYPDGRILSVVRDPWSWFVSASRWSARYGDRRVALRRWLRTAEATLAYREANPERILAVAFDDLVLSTRETMERICAFLGLPFEESLLAPTLAGRPADANSSFRDVAAGVAEAPVRARRSRLAADEERAIAVEAGDTWERLLAAARLEVAA